MPSHILWFVNINTKQRSLKTPLPWTSLVVQWLRIHLPMQGDAGFIPLARGYPLITSIIRDLEKYNHTKCLEEGGYLVDSNNVYYCFPLWAKDTVCPLHSIWNILIPS